MFTFLKDFFKKMDSDGPAAAARRRQQTRETVEACAALHAPVEDEAKKKANRPKAKKPRTVLPSPIRAVVSVWMLTQLLLGWVVLWLIQCVARVIAFPFTTATQREDMCGHIHRKTNYVFVMFLNPLWWTSVLRPFPMQKLAAAKSKKVICMMCHLSNADPWFAIRPMGLPVDCKWVCKGSLFNVPFGGWGLKNAGDLAIKFTEAKDGWGTEKGSVGQLMADAKVLLERDQPIAVFPEGVRSFNPDGPLGEFKLGFFMLAVEQKANIVPVAFSGTETAWPRGSWMFDFARVYSSCGDPISAEGETPESLRDKVWVAITELRESHPDRIALKRRLAKKN